MEDDQKKVWAKRAKRYNNLEWVNKEDIVGTFIDLCDLESSDIVLDVGCGTGKIICSICDMVKEGHGMDISEEMLSFIDKDKYKNLFLKIGDITNTDYKDNTFDKITARLIFHHLVNEENLKKAIMECYRILKPNGRIIISEGVPPHKDLKEDYTRIFELKEKRIVFLPEDFERILKEGGFRGIEIHEVIDRGMSIRNWLDNDGTLSEETKKQIFDLHRDSSDLFKEAYNLKEVNDDILIDVKVIIAIGLK